MFCNTCEMIARTKLVILTTIVAASLTLGIVAASGIANIFLQSASAQYRLPPTNPTPTTSPGGNPTSGNSTSGNATK
jgi:hypothetical protein